MLVFSSNTHTHTQITKPTQSSKQKKSEIKALNYNKNLKTRKKAFEYYIGEWMSQRRNARINPIYRILANYSTKESASFFGLSKLWCIGKNVDFSFPFKTTVPVIIGMSWEMEILLKQKQMAEWQGEWR